MKYHFIGISGISMSAIADFLRSKGHQVTGSDLKSGGHSADNITQDIDVVVRTSAVSPGSPGWVEVEAAQKLGIKVMKRSELLGQITSDYELIAVSGMHGKTTTTSLVGLAMIDGGLDPTVLVGEHIQEFSGSALHVGKSKYFVMEACEYDKSFLDFHPSVLILTNIDEEHLDTYPGGITEIKETFKKYLQNVRPGGLIIANKENENVREVLKDLPQGVDLLWYGAGSGKYQEFSYQLSIPGEHNRSNALAVVALADYYSIASATLSKVFADFKGAKRRMEYWGELGNSLLFDDYGHHPTEIRATISAMKEKFPDKKLVVIFWPHQYKRIRPLLKQFSESFHGADKVFVKDIYFVPGRDEILDVNSTMLAKMISEGGIDAASFAENEDIHDQIAELSKQDCVMLTIGIPPIYKLWEEMIGE